VARSSARGGGRQGDVEIIDLLDVDTGWMPYQADIEPIADESDPDPQRPQRAWIGAAVAVTVVGGALAVLSIDGDSRSAAPTTSIETSTTATPRTTKGPASTTVTVEADRLLPTPETPTERLVPIVADPPAGFQWTYGYEGSEALEVPGIAVVYSDEVTGDWIILEIARRQDWDFERGEFRRALTDGRVALVTTEAQMSNARAADDDYHYSLTSNAPIDEVLPMLGTVRMLGPDSPLVDYPRRFRPITTIASSEGGGSVWDDALSANLAMTSSTGDSIFIETRAAMPPSLRAMWSLLLPNTDGSVDEDAAVRWNSDGSLRNMVLVPMVNQDVMISGDGDVPMLVLLDIAARLRLATKEEWQRLAAGDFDATDPQPVADVFGTTSLDGAERSVRVQGHRGRSWIWIEQEAVGVNVDLDLPSPQIVSSATTDGTYVLAVAPADIGGWLVIDRADGPSTTTLLDAIDETWPYVIAVAEVEELEGWTASVVGNDGTVTVLS
jgi:hypothetical protein